MGCCQTNEELNTFQVSLNHRESQLNSKKIDMNLDNTMVNQTNTYMDNDPYIIDYKSSFIEKSAKRNEMNCAAVSKHSSTKRVIDIKVKALSLSTHQELRNRSKSFEINIERLHKKLEAIIELQNNDKSSNEFDKRSTFGRRLRNINMEKYKHIFEDGHLTMSQSTRKKSPFESRRKHVVTNFY